MPDNREPSPLAFAMGVLLAFAAMLVILWIPVVL